MLNCKFVVTIIYKHIHILQQGKKIFWIAQVGGWLFYYLAMSFFYLMLRTHEQPGYFGALLGEVILGFLFTLHLHQRILKKNILDRALKGQIRFLLIATFLYSILLAVLVTFSNIIIGTDTPNGTLLFSIAANWFTDFMLILIWNLLYLGYHYVVKSNREALDKVRLETMVKDLELKTIKAHINPHFIFNALNSIKALVEEDPERTRTAITELSNILRSSLREDKQETTELANELAIVQDYLALEKIRFEDRLQVRLDIDEDTLSLPIPPMMLQTLVENGIKHGIAHAIDGGKVGIQSKLVDDRHEIKVENTGRLQPKKESSGFGIESTQHRLRILFGKESRFGIANSDHGTVIATIQMPVSISQKTIITE